MSHFETDDLTESLDIAIIGMAGSFPGARNLDQFWQNLRDGVCSVSFFSDEALRAVGVEETLLANPHYVKAGGVLDGIEQFDASFFGYSPREAEGMDPQQRLFLECAWEAVENAGYEAGTYEGVVGVYAGAGMNSYLLFNVGANREFMATVGANQIRLGNNNDFLANRVSYKLGLEGPSVAIQTACSTSLVAVHFACQGLLSYQCDMALAGGVSINVRQNQGYLYQEEGILSPDGYCRAFDAEAKGTVGGSGVGLVVLKRLADAVAGGDHIYAVIKGSAVNNDGAAKVGFTAPREDGQAVVIATALAMAGVEAESIGYVEGHGAGTSLGDPIEVSALIQAFRATTEKRQFCALGSVKTNIGHLDSASGVAGLIKTVLSLKHNQIPPSLNFEEPNPKIDFEESPFFVNTALRPWPENGLPRRAGVSSFGLGGTNAHVVLEEAPPQEPSGPSRPWQLLLLSAQTPSALEAATDQMVDYLKQNQEQNLADIAYTLQAGRRSFAHRHMVVCRDCEDAAQALETRDTTRLLFGIQEAGQRPVAFMFSGLGDHYVDMGAALYKHEATFREWIDRCAQLLQPHLGLDLREVLYPERETAVRQQEPQTAATSPSGLDLRRMLKRDTPQTDAFTRRLNRTELAQPILFALEYALAQMWMSWGIRPQAMAGYSIGEYVAACVAGVISLEDALSVVAKRAQLIHTLPAGAMLALPLSEAEVTPLLNADVSLAGVNGPALCVVAGPQEAVDELATRLREQEVVSWPLQTSHAFHSAMMAPVKEALADLMAAVSLHPPQVPYLSNVTGTWITAAEATDPAYWARHLCQPVRFASAVHTLWQTPGQALLEIGPGQTLCSLALQHPAGVGLAERTALPTLPDAYGQQEEMAFIMRTIGRLWLAGVEVDWQRFYAGEQRRRLPLPTYPFERERYWVEAQASALDSGQPSTSLAKNADMGTWFYVPSWKRVPLPLPASSEEEETPPQNWLLFVDESHLGSQLAQRLQAAGHTVTAVSMAESLQKGEDGTYALNPQNREEYDLLFQELSAAGQLPHNIVHLWNVTLAETAVAPLACLQEAQYAGFYSLLYIAQALDKQNVTGAVQIWAIANGLHDVNGGEKVQPQKATLLGPCKIIPQEYPNMVCRSIDVVIPETAGSQEAQLLDQLFAELHRRAPARTIAYRGPHRWVQTFEPLHVGAVSTLPARLRQGGTYLITGGLGKIGLVLAEYLAKSVQAKLALVGRSPFPPRAAWDEWLATHGKHDETALKIRKVQALEALGAGVLVLCADVADEAQMQRAIDRVYEHFGQLNGVMHLAGSVGEKAHRTIPEVGQVEYEWHFLPKVRGLYVLEKVLSGRHYDFCLLASSLASVLGGLGFVAYAAANLFMNAFAQARSGPWTSLVWEGWKFQEQVETSHLGESVLQLAITPEEGVEIFKRVLSLPATAEIIVSTGDLASRINAWTQLDFSDKETDQESEAMVLHPRPNLRNPYVAPGNRVERDVAQIWQELLGVEKVGIHDNFFELGGNSLMGLQVVHQLRKQLNLSVPLTILYEGPTISTLANLVTDYDQDSR